MKDVSPNFPLFPEFKEASYAERYNILCRKLIAERLYTAATVILSPRTASKSGDYSEMSDMTGLAAALRIRNKNLCLFLAGFFFILLRLFFS